MLTRPGRTQRAILPAPSEASALSITSPAHLVGRPQRIELRGLQIESLDVLGPTGGREHALERARLLPLEQRPRRAKLAGARGTADAMNVLAHVDRRIVVDDVLDVRQVDAARDEIGADEPETVRSANDRPCAHVDLAILEGGQYTRALGRRLIARVGGSGDGARGVGVSELEQLDQLGETRRGLDRLGEAEGVGDAGRVEQVEEQQRLVLRRGRDVVLLRWSDAPPGLGTHGERRRYCESRAAGHGRTAADLEVDRPPELQRRELCRIAAECG